LGFTHYCVQRHESGTFTVWRITAKKRMVAKQRHLKTMLRGFYQQYFGLHHCKPRLDAVRDEVQLPWFRVLRRHSQRHRLFWGYLQSCSWSELPYAERRRAAM
jgi:hypothetical protein